MGGTVWVINNNYAEFALIRKFFVAGGGNSKDVVQYATIEYSTETNHSPSLIFVDNNLSELQSADQVAAFCKWYEQVPIILLADNEDTTTLQLVSEIGAQDYLLKKEITLPLFRKCIQYAIDRKQINNELQRSRNEYMRIFEHHPLPMWLYDMQTLAFIAVNHAAVYYYGYSEEEFLSMTIKDIRPKQDVPALLNTVNRDYKSGFYDNNRWTHVTKSGEHLNIHIFSHTADFGGKQCKMVTAVNINGNYNTRDNN